MFTSNAPISNWHARRVWIIGASEGIGLALAHRLSIKKAELIVSARNESRLREEFSDIAKVLPLDVTNTEQIETAMKLLIFENMVPDTVFWLPCPLPTYKSHQLRTTISTRTTADQHYGGIQPISKNDTTLACQPVRR
jgi:hypothetical protein